jgi:EAL domain-containing protein (putative c-di-GMP-specific phosphodiesterase class I)
MQFSMVERAVLMNDLNGSVERGELKVYYQPALRLNNQQVAGFEALVRWEHPRRGLLTPGSFIPLAEESGYIHDLGYFVLHEACRQMREWQLRYPEMDSPVINVNVSAHQIQKPGFVQLVRQVLDETGIDPAYLVLELTESVLIRNSDEVIDTLRGLKALGLNLALDDFGTGYSSLGYLKQFPIDILKIDRAFIEAMNDSDRDRMMVQTVIDLGHMLRLEMVAEGIERDEQLSSLLQLNCTQGQGFLFSHAVNASDAEVMLRAQAQRSAASIEEVA